MDAELKKRILNYIGGCVDVVSITVPNTLKPLIPKRKIDRETYEKQIDYLYDKGFVDNPETFFTLPEKKPDYKVIISKPFYDGTYQVISYPSGYKTINPFIREKFDSYISNRTGYMARWVHGDGGRKTIVCLHGLFLGNPLLGEKMFKIKRFYKMGFDVVMFVAPFHWRRLPKNILSRGLFLQPDDVVMTSECFGQSIYDLYSLYLILKDMGSGEIGIIGASLGGYIASIFVSLTDVVSFSAMIVPAIDFSSTIKPETFSLPFPLDEALLTKIKKVWQFYSPLNLSPKISSERILFISSVGDRLCPFTNVKMLCEIWNWPRMKSLTGGHWLIFNKKERGEAWSLFLRDMGFIEC